MKNLRGMKRAGALGLICAILFLCAQDAYVRADVAAAETFGTLAGQDPEGEREAAGTVTERGAGLTSRQETAGPETVEKPGEEETQGETAAKSDGEETQEETAAKPGEEETQEETAAKPGEEETQGETAAKPGEEETQGETAAKPDEEETQGETAAKPGGEETQEETAAKPDGEETQRETAANPGEDAGDRTGISGQEPSEAGSEAPASPDSIDYGELEDAQKGTEADTEQSTERALQAVFEDAARQNIDFLGLAPGESLTFYASIPQAGDVMPIGVTAVKVTRAEKPFSYEDYGYGSYLTYMYTVSFRDITTLAYCIQPSLPSPSGGSNYLVSRLTGAKTLAKVCYYGNRKSGSNCFFEERYPEFSTGQRFILTHMAAAHANGSADAFSGASSKGRALAMELYNYCCEQPDIPAVDMAFSDANVTAYVEGEIQRTKEITFQADTLQTVKFRLPQGVTLHNVTTRSASQPGGEVQLSGGTKFYLTAPLSQAADVGPVWSKTMKGSITRDFSAYKITVSGGYQDLALVFGDGVEDEKYVDFSVRWVEQEKTNAVVSVRKTDAATGAYLAGAVFGVYADAACTSLLAQMPPTGPDGKASVELDGTQDTVYLKELTPPVGYRKNETVYPVTPVQEEEALVTVPDEEQLGSLTICKEGPVLAGAQKTEDGVVFRYETRRLSGAVYDVRAGADIVTPGGETLYRSGDPVAEHLVTNESGQVSLGNLHFGVYTITEVQAPENYYNGRETRTVTVSAADDHPLASFEEVFSNDLQRAEVCVRKEDSQTHNPLAGAIYGIFAAGAVTDAAGKVLAERDTLLEKLTTGEDGTAVCASQLPVGFSYYVKELRAPDGYLRSEEVFSFDFAYTRDQEASVTFTHTFQNNRVSARIRLIKRDAATGTPQGDATLRQAVYGLYAREDIVHPDGKTGVLFRAGEQIAVLTTDDAGEASAENLYLGKYFVREITPSYGYLLDGTEYELTCDSEGDLVATVERECISDEEVIRQPFQLIKASENGKTDADLLEGAGFTAYLESAIPRTADGAYDFEAASPVALGPDGATEIFTDSAGYAVSVPLPFGTYLVRETTTPANFLPVKDFLVRITEHHPDKPQVWRVLLDREFEARLKITKQDDETHRPVLAPNTEFRVYDLEKGEYVEQATSYPTPVVHTSYFTDESGCLVLPEQLAKGRYRVEEATAPDGYTVHRNYIEVEIAAGNAYRMDYSTGEATVEVAYENHPVKGELRIVKEGERLSGYEKGFVYETCSLAGAVLEVRAAEDIYSADFQEDAQGNRILEYAKDALVAELTTDGNGEAVLKDLPLGTYKIVEKKAPEGFALSDRVQTVQLAYEDQETPVVRAFARVVNERQKARVIVRKEEKDTGRALAGAVFALCTKEDLCAEDGSVLLKADTVLEECVTGETGEASFAADLPLGGTYCVKELQAPAGFVSRGETREFCFAYDASQKPFAEFLFTFQNEPTVVEIAKQDAVGGEEVPGAKLKVTDERGTTVDEWISGMTPHIIRGLVAGKNYTLHEESAPKGYVVAQEAVFQVEDSGEVQSVRMTDERVMGRVVLEKTDRDTGKPMKGVTFVLYDSSGAELETLVTDRKGRAGSQLYPVAEYRDGVCKRDIIYTLKEKETLDGYQLDETEHEIRFEYEDAGTPVAEYRLELTNGRVEVREENAPRTGDGTNLLLPVLGMAAAASVLAAMCALRRRRSR